MVTKSKVTAKVPVHVEVVKLLVLTVAELAGAQPDIATALSVKVS